MTKKNDTVPAKTQNGSRFALIILALLTVLFVSLYFFQEKNTRDEIAYTAFTSLVLENSIRNVTIQDSRIILGTYRSPINGKLNFKTVIPYEDTNLIPMLKENNIEVLGELSGVDPFTVIIQVLPFLALIFIMWLMFRQNQGNGNKAFTFGKSKARLYDSENKKVSFSDVAGQREAKTDLEEVVDYLKTPQKYVKMGAKIPKGVLLVGMPGTGKTLLARAVAGEANVPFFHISGSDFVEMFVGVGASRVRDLFEQGRKSAPCIIFIDELDAVGRTRGAGYGGGHDEREQTLNQMLVEMDGFDSKEGVIVLAATNRPDVLDPALLRPGRFDRQITVAMPDIREREDILNLHAKKVQIDTNVDLNKIARATPGTSGADLANLINEAALFSARKNKEMVSMEEIEEARDKLLMGSARSSMVITEEEKRATAFHEAGHALLHYFLDHADPLHKVTIVPRGGALGLAISLPEKDIYSRGKNWLLDRLVIMYGGYAAEKIMFNETTTGVKQDLEQATKLAKRMVCEWGMSLDMGAVTYGHDADPVFLAKDISRQKDYSEEAAHGIDLAVRNILENALQRAIDILETEKEKLQALAEELILKETLADSDIRGLLNI